MAGRRKLSDAQRAEILQLHDKEGMTFAELADRYQVNWRTIARICHPAKYEAELARNAEYNRQNAQTLYERSKETSSVFHFRLSHSANKEMIAHLRSQSNVSDYLRDLVQKDMNNSKI